MFRQSLTTKSLHRAHAEFQVAYREHSFCLNFYFSFVVILTAYNTTQATCFVMLCIVTRVCDDGVLERIWHVEERECLARARQLRRSK